MVKEAGLDINQKGEEEDSSLKEGLRAFST